MKNTNKYEAIVNEKFREFSFPEMDATWPGMKAILDKEMPEKRRRGSVVGINLPAGIACALLVLTLFCLPVYTHNSRTASHQQGTIAHATDKMLTQPENKITSHDRTTDVLKQRSEKRTDRKQIKLNNFPQLKTTSPIKPADFAGEIRSSIRSIQETPADSKPADIGKQLSDQSKSVSIINADSNDEQSTSLQRRWQEIVFYQPNWNIGAISSGKMNDTISKEPFIAAEKKELPTEDTNLTRKAKSTSGNKGWVAGASINYNLPVSNQEMSTVNSNGKREALVDLLPSVYLQYHINRKWFIESSFEFNSPQYISSLKLSSKKNYPNPNKCEESAVWLNKLYYLNVPFSVHFRPLTNLSIGGGIQYSYLRRSIFEDEQATWEKQPGAGWTKIASMKTVKVKSGNGNLKSNNGNGNRPTPGNPGGPQATQIDTVAHTLRSTDWRLLFELNYNWKRLNAGCRFDFGLNNYIQTKAGNNVLPVKDRNQALQLYLRYDILDKRKK